MIFFAPKDAQSALHNIVWLNNTILSIMMYILPGLVCSWCGHQTIIKLLLSVLAKIMTVYIKESNLFPFLHFVLKMVTQRDRKDHMLNVAKNGVELCKVTLRLVPQCVLLRAVYIEVLRGSN